MPSPDHSSLKKAVHKNKALSSTGLLERAFTAAFSGMVYPQIWEDPIADMKALEIEDSTRIITISSGGCNAMSYLTKNPESITAVDLNHTHIALLNLKIQAAKRLPDYDAFYQFFGNARAKDNMRLYERYIQPHLDDTSRAYWESKAPMRKPRIERFTSNFYKYGLLGRFIGFVHFVARRYGVDPSKITKAKNIQEQIAFYETEFAPLFEKRMIKTMLKNPTSLFGLGIPPAQYEALAADADGDITKVVLERLRKLCCDFPIEDNYFAWQAFGRTYEPTPEGSLPPYLQKENYELIKERSERITPLHRSYTDVLEEKGEPSLDRYILLDAQDWMPDEDLTRIWKAITLTARPGARVIFRTAADERLLPGRVPDEILNKWDYKEEQAKELHKTDRSSIYGAFHIYHLK